MTSEMKKTLYLECKTGISGDMAVAALLDLGADREGLMRALKGLHVDGYEVHVTRTSRRGMAGCDFDVILEHDERPHHHHVHGERDDVHKHSHHVHGAGEEHSHDGGYHYHKHRDENDAHAHRHGHGHHHEHDHDHDERHYHEHRNLHDIFHIIEGADLTPRAAAIARRAFEIVAEAEAKAHGIPVDEVHFHEVGAVDSIVDIVSAAYCLDNLEVDEVVVPYLNEGNGTIRCQHGVLPVPVPAVTNIVAAHGISLRIIDVANELVTPTGAAIIAAIRTSEILPQAFKVEKVGIGLGKRNIGRPNFLRAMLVAQSGEFNESGDRMIGEYAMLESNIDDSTGEQLGLTMEKLIAEGALDVHYIPCFMKKNRPGYLLRVVCFSQNIPALEDVIFRNTTTIGIRRTPFERTSLRREQIEIALPYGNAVVKKCYWRDEIFYYPEFESVKSLANSSGQTFDEVYVAAKVAAAK